MAPSICSSLCALLVFSAAASAFPANHPYRRQRMASQPYQAPGPEDARAPCPALNTLANHGYINHDGRDIEQQDIIDAFAEQFGIEQTAIDLALVNAFIVCDYVTGTDCGTTLKNLTILAEPHTFEHDHSFSRQDYMPAYLPDNVEYADNQNFNRTIFQTSLEVLEGSTHMNYAQMNQVRLQRESLSLGSTRPGWFEESIPIQEFESGFIFAVMGDFNLPNYNTTPEVRVEWWDYWFTNESFPYELGWHPPAVPRGADFVLSASSAVLAAQLTSTPTPIPSGALQPAPEPGTLTTLGSAVATTTYAIPTFTPYAAPGVGPNDKRKRDDAASPIATSGVMMKNPYMEKLDFAGIAAQQAAATSRMAALAAAVTGSA